MNLKSTKRLKNKGCCSYSLLRLVILPLWIYLVFKTQNNILSSRIKSSEKSSTNTESVAESHKEELRDTPPPALINKALLGICRLENKIQKLLPQNLSAPFGGSLLVVGKNMS